MLLNRCWEGRLCPETQAQADKYRGQLIVSIINERDNAITQLRKQGDGA